jgi:hypothetical protein
VNSIKRTSAAIAAGAHSIDGSSATRYAMTLPKLATPQGSAISSRCPEACQLSCRIQPITDAADVPCADAIDTGHFADGAGNTQIGPIRMFSTKRDNFRIDLPRHFAVSDNDGAKVLSHRFPLEVF